MIRPLCRLLLREGPGLGVDDSVDGCMESPPPPPPALPPLLLLLLLLLPPLLLLPLELLLLRLPGSLGLPEGEFW